MNTGWTDGETIEDIQAMEIVSNYTVGNGPRPGFFHSGGKTYYYSFAGWNGFGKSGDEVREDGQTWDEYWNSLKPKPHKPWWQFWSKKQGPNG